MFLATEIPNLHEDLKRVLIQLLLLRGLHCGRVFVFWGISPGESRVWSWPGSFGQKLLIPESRESQKKKQNLQEDEDPQGKPQEW